MKAVLSYETSASSYLNTLSYNAEHLLPPYKNRQQLIKSFRFEPFPVGKEATFLLYKPYLTLR
jgi:hypothetical protein